MRGAEQATWPLCVCTCLRMDHDHDCVENIRVCLACEGIYRLSCNIAFRRDDAVLVLSLA